MLILGIFLNVFYIIFTPLTIYPLYFLLNIFFSASIAGNIIIADGASIEIINACIAGSAFYLLLVLNLSTPKIKLKKRVLILLFDYSILLAFNIIRIFLLSILLVNNSAFFDITHKIFWYALSIIFVFLIWIFTIKIFKIKEVPFVSDIKLLNTARK